MFKKVANGQAYKMHQMYTESNHRHYELWGVLQLYAVMFLHWPKQPQRWKTGLPSNKKMQPIKTQLRHPRGATCVCHITWSNSSTSFAMGQQITRHDCAQKRCLRHEIDTACIPGSRVGNHALTAATYCKIVFAMAEHPDPLS